MENLVILNNLTLPSELVEATDKAVEAGKAKSRDSLIARALMRELAAIKRGEIDAELAEMAKDAEYQAEVLKLSAEFANASWKAWQIGEAEYEEG